jgi:hypothetical protein
LLYIFFYLLLWRQWLAAALPGENCNRYAGGLAAKFSENLYSMLRIYAALGTVLYGNSAQMAQIFYDLRR